LDLYLVGIDWPPLFAHIHFGLKRRQLSRDDVFFAVAPRTIRPSAEPIVHRLRLVSITGTTTAADIFALNTPGATTDQGLDEHDFAGFLRALRAGSALCEHAHRAFPGGEIRGQIAVRSGEGDDDN